MLGPECSFFAFLLKKPNNLNENIDQWEKMWEM